MKRIITAFLTIALAFSIASCNAVKEGAENVSEGNIQQGIWDAAGKTFTNEWSNIKFTLPEGYTAASAEEIEQNYATDLIYYDFVVYPAEENGTIMVSLFYENIAMDSQKKNLNEQGYINHLSDSLKGSENEFTLVEITPIEIAGESWTFGKFSINNGEGYQNFYLHIVNGIANVVLITYTVDSEGVLGDIITAFERIK
jgi:hypothetical protein